MPANTSTLGLSKKKEYIFSTATKRHWKTRGSPSKTECKRCIFKMKAAFDQAAAKLKFATWFLNEIIRLTRMILLTKARIRSS